MSIKKRISNMETGLEILNQFDELITSESHTNRRKKKITDQTDKEIKIIEVCKENKNGYN